MTLLKVLNTGICAARMGKYLYKFRVIPNARTALTYQFPDARCSNIILLNLNRYFPIPRTQIPVQIQQSNAKFNGSLVIILHIINI